MKASQQKVLDRFIQVLSYLDAHQEVVPATAVSSLQQQLAAAVDEIAAYARTQASRGVTSGGATSVRAARQALRDTYMRQVATMGISRLTGRHPGDPAMDKAAQIFKMPATRTNSRELISSAQAMVQAALPYANLFAAHGVDIRMTAAAAQGLERSLEESATAVRTHIGATAGMAGAIRSGHDAVRLIDVVIRPFIAGNAELVGQWKKARRTAGGLNLGDPVPVAANLLASVEAQPVALPSPTPPLAALTAGEPAPLPAAEPAEPAAVAVEVEDPPAAPEVAAAA